MKTPIKVENGAWEGKMIRRARKAGQCDYFKGIEGHCQNLIETGDLYMAGELNDKAGGYGQDRYCLECAGAEAREAANKAT